MDNLDMSKVSQFTNFFVFKINKLLELKLCMASGNPKFVDHYSQLWNLALRSIIAYPNTRIHISKVLASCVNYMPWHEAQMKKATAPPPNKPLG